MRKIKFRAWSYSFEQMVKWEDLKFDKDQGDRMICFYEQADGSDSIWDGGANYTIMQYTGLKDQFGTEIYEGDIVKDSYSGFIGKVVYEDFMFNVEGFFDSSNDYPTIAFSEGIFEVIGNIYENPELLEESE